MRRRRSLTASRPKCSGARRSAVTLPFTLSALAVLTCLTFPGCDDPIAATPPRYSAPLRSGAELASELQSLCEQAGADRPVLVEFSAAWCSDCQRLQEMKRAKALEAELAQWPQTTINVGRFDRHRDILDAMEIESIAHWSVLAPTSCGDPIQHWTRIADRTLEVSSGEARSLTPDDLARWLRGFRAS